MSQHPINELLGNAMGNLKSLIDANTIIGEPIAAADGVTIIPVSKVSFGFASGGSDLPTTQPKEVFGGGSGGGVTIQPIAFLVISGGDVKILHVYTSNNTADRIVNTVPEVIDKIAAMLPKKEGKNTEPEAKS